MIIIVWLQSLENSHSVYVETGFVCRVYRRLYHKVVLSLVCTHCEVVVMSYTRWFKYDRDYLCVNKSQFVPVIFEPPCILLVHLVENSYSKCT